MFRKKKWIVVGILAAVVVIVAGIVGGAVIYAQSATTPSVSNPGKNLADRVATILGVDQTKVENAFLQAEKDMRDEALTNRLNSLVSQGKMTKDQADQYKKWVESRPNVPGQLGLQGSGPMGLRGGFRCLPGPGQPPIPPAPSNSPNVTQ